MEIKIRTKLLVSFILIAIITSILALVGITKIKTVDDQDTILYERVTKALGNLAYVTQYFQKIRVTYRDYVLENDKDKIKMLIEERKKYSENITNIMENFKESIKTDEGEKKYDDFKDARTVTITLLERLENYAIDNKDSLAYLLINAELKDAVVKQEAAIETLIEHKISNGKTIADNNTEIANGAVMMMIILMIITIVFAMLLGIGLSINIQSIIKAVITQVKELTTAAVNGTLSKRADEKSTNHEFRDIIDGFNKTLDAVIIPLNVAANYVDKISKGDIPHKITDNYYGDFNTIKNNLNQCIDAVNLLVTDASILSKAAVEGRLQTRADATRHQGDFRKIVQGVNATIDAVINPLNVAADYVDKISKGNIPPKITKINFKNQLTEHPTNTKKTKQNDILDTNFEKF